MNLTAIAELRPVPAPDDPIVALIAGLIAILAALVLASTAPDSRERTVRLLFLYLAYGIFEVVVKRLAHFSWFLYPIRFGLFFSVVASWLGSDRRRVAIGNLPLSGLLGTYLGLAALQIFNPIQANPIVGVLGWLSDFAFVVFYFIAFDLFDDVRTTRRFMYMTAALGIASAAVCLLEQWIGPDELMRRYPTFVHLLYFAPGGVVIHRPSMLSPYSEVFAIAAMLGLIESRRGSSALWAIGIALCVVANILHAVRIGWFTGFAIVALLVLFSRRRRVMNAIVITASIVLAVNVGMTVTDGQIESSLTSATTPLRTFQEKRLWGVQAIPLVMSDYPFGVGVGESSPGVRFLNPTDIRNFSTHNYLADLTGQMSILGPLLLLTFSGRVLLKVGRTIQAAKADEWRSHLNVAFAIFGALAISLFGGGGLGGYPVSDYFWLTAGAAMGLTFARQRQAARARPAVVLRSGLVLVSRRAMSQRRSAI